MIALSPNQTFPFTLDVDAARPESRRRGMISRFLSAGMMAEMDALSDEASEKSGEDEKALMLKVLSVSEVKFRGPGSKETESVTLTFDGEANLKLEEKTKVYLQTLAGDELSRMQLVFDSSGAAPKARLDAYVSILEACKARMERPSGDPPKWSDATLEELLELVSRILQLSRIIAADSLSDLPTRDLWDVFAQVLKLSKLTEIERKKSALQSASAAARKSARTVNLASA